MTEEHKPAQHAENCCWHPDGCDCELGRLRAEVEKWKGKAEKYWGEGIHSCGPHCQRIACVQRREIEKLRDWQWLALPLIRCWLALSQEEKNQLQDKDEMQKVSADIDKLIAEAEEQPDD